MLTIFENMAPSTMSVRFSKMMSAFLRGIILVSIINAGSFFALAQYNYPNVARKETPYLPNTIDRREPANTNYFPYSAIVKIEITYPNGKVTWGTGALIGPTTVLTADHVVYSAADGGDAKSLRILPGYSNGKTTCNPTWAVSWKHGSHQGCHDGAVCDVAVVETNDKVGCSTGWFGFKEYDPNNLNGLNVAGYPQDLSSTGENLYVVQTNAVRETSEGHNIITYRDWTAGGMSGGPIFTDDYYIVGVHSGGGENENYGVALCNQLYESVKGWWSESNSGVPGVDRRNK